MAAITKKRYRKLGITIGDSSYDKNERILHTHIKKEKYDQLLEILESAKENDTIIYACDGDAWEFIQYDNGKEIWKRDIGHIYEIQPLEELAKILRDIGYSISK